ncbi:MAG: pantetheine-phosphate adenylyltransferase [Hyphomicrobiaceae bacterium]
MKRIGFYSGSFDPVTLGHTDVIERAAAIVDRLVIGIGVHPSKSPMFAAAERAALLEAETAPIAAKTGCEIVIDTFDNLAIEAARKVNATVIFRGLRDGTDFDYEMQMAGMNGAMAADLQTIFVPSSPNVRHIASGLVRQVAFMGGDASQFVSPAVAESLVEKVRRARG